MTKPQRILYLDCFSGISGDMFLGALLDIGASEAMIRAGLAGLPMANEFELMISKTAQSGITGTRVRVELRNGHAHGHNHDIDHDQEHGNDHGHEHSHDHSHDHHHADHDHENGLRHEHGHGHRHHHEHEHGRSYADIVAMLGQANLSEPCRSLALATFAEIGRAEAAVHGVSLADVHFHEVGAVDSIVDIVGAALALESLQIDKVVASPISDGEGIIQCQHGLIPVPVPAVLKMLENTSIPYRTGTASTELVTPTGLGLVKTLAVSYGGLPAMQVRQVGYGFGQREIGRLNALRVVLGEIANQELAVMQNSVINQESAANPGSAVIQDSAADHGQVAMADHPSLITSGPQGETLARPLTKRVTDADAHGLSAFSPQEMDTVVLLSCHVDNASGEQLGFAAERLMAAGALDVTLTPLQMKKWRPGQMLTVITTPDLEASLVRLIFQDAGTIGIRRQICQRHVCRRSFVTLTLPDGDIRMKVVSWQDVTHAYPEQADLVALAIRRQISLDAARDLVRSIWQQSGQ